MTGLHRFLERERIDGARANWERFKDTPEGKHTRAVIDARSRGTTAPQRGICAEDERVEEERLEQG